MKFYQIICLLLAVILCIGLTACDVLGGSQAQARDAEADFRAAASAVQELVKDDYSTVNIHSTQYADEMQYVRMHVSLDGASTNMYYRLSDGTISCFTNYDAVSKELMQLFYDRTLLPPVKAGSLTLSSMGEKKMLYYGDTTMNDVIRSTSPYYVTGRLAYEDASLFKDDTLDRFLKCFSNADIQIYVYDAVFEQSELRYEGEPTVRYVKEDGVVHVVRKDNGG